MQMFNQAHHFNIYGGHYVNNNLTATQGKEKHKQLRVLRQLTNFHCLDILTKLNPVVNASFKSDYHTPCFEGTRTGILQMLMEWAKNPDSQPIFWLSGIAGTGKSTIAQSFCENLEKENLLGASFFCSRELKDLRDVGRIVPTLAYFLSQHFELYSEQIIVALKQDETLASQGIKRQFDSLLLHPFQNINVDQENWHFVLVIDALDECEDMDATQNILSILRAMPAQFYAHIHVFISCRPEYYIQQEFERTSNKDLFKLHDMEDEIVQKDIQLYLQRSLESRYISENNIIHLSNQAGKLFIYAFTQVQYLNKAPSEVAFKSRLNDLLENKGIAESIDIIYNLLLTKVMADMTENEKKDARYFLNLVISLADPLSQHALSELWKPCDGTPFRSVLNIPDSEQQPMHIFHASFPDYILTKDRCHVELYCNPHEIHESLAVACLNCMNKNLKYNICNMETDDNVSSFLKENISSSLEYSCKYWIFHLIKCGGSSSEILTELENFTKEKFFFWMEVLCILQYIENAILGLKDISHWLQV